MGDALGEGICSHQQQRRCCVPEALKGQREKNSQTGEKLSTGEDDGSLRRNGFPGNGAKVGAFNVWI